MSGAYHSLEDLPQHVRTATHRFLDHSCILAITDLRGTIVYANDGFVRISGYPREELVGQNHRMLKSGQHAPVFYRDMWRTVARGDIWTGEICNRARDGRLYWVEASIAPLRDDDGKITHYCALRVDITARKDAQQRLVETMEQNAERRHLEAVGRMADGILHDLNNLLGGAMMLTDPAEAGPQAAAEQRVFLTRMAQLIRNVRDFSTGRMPEVKVCDAARALDEAFRLASYVARRGRDITIEVDTARVAGCLIRINEAQLLEVLLNLFTNAAEALADRPAPRLAVRAEADSASRCIHVFVTDNGPGVSADVAARLFEPYVSSKGRGRGVGLAAARRIARGLEGELSLLPSQGGAHFELRLPIAEILQPARPASVPPEAASRHGELVLLADDDREFLAMLEAGLREFGYRTIAASAADEAILLAEHFRGCLTAAVLDSLGPVNERTLVGFLRSVNRDIPIVLVSGTLARAGTQDTQHGPVHVLPKPFAATELVAILRGTKAAT